MRRSNIADSSPRRMVSDDDATQARRGLFHGLFRGRKLAAVASSSAALLVGGGIAYATISAPATMTGFSRTLSAPDPVLITGAPSGSIIPEELVPLTGFLINSNRFKVQVSSIHVRVAAVTGSGGTCRTSDFAVTDVTGPWTIPAATDDENGQLAWSGGTITIPNPTAGNQTGCLQRSVALSFTTAP